MRVPFLTASLIISSQAKSTFSTTQTTVKHPDYTDYTDHQSIQTTQTTNATENECDKLPGRLWNLQGCDVEDPNATTVTGLGNTKAFINFVSCEISCPEDGDSFHVEALQMDVCDPGLEDTGFPNEGYFLPMWLPGENLVSAPLRTILYFVFLIYCFVGVAIIADIFMGAIEVITSSRREVEMEDGRTFHVRVWNDTVANLTLMALGSSAPEIILSVIEVVSSGFFAGALGPSTIVGSAAFNLFCIAALCVVSVGEPARYIRYQPVFFVTAIFSVLAYVWLVFILAVQTPHLVEVWEGVTSFVFFIVLVIIAYLGDRGLFTICCKKKTPKIALHKRVAPSAEEEKYMGLVRQIIARENSEVTSGDIVNILKTIRKDDAKLSNHEAAKILKRTVEQERGMAPHSRAYYRSFAMTSLIHGRDLVTGIDTPTVNDDVKKTLEKSKTQMVRDNKFLKWSSTRYKVKQELGAKVRLTKVRLTLERGSALRMLPQSVAINTIDKKAVHGKDFVALEGHVVHFAPGDMSAELMIDILSKTVFDDTECFAVQMINPQPDVRLVDDGMASVSIINNAHNGVLAFKQPTYYTAESEKKVVLTICRHEGCDNDISVKWKTQDITAIADSDYIGESDGLVSFKQGECEKQITIEIVDDEDYEKDEAFLVTLFDPSEGAIFYNDNDGGDEEEIAKVIIISDEKQKKLVDEMSLFLHINQDRIKIGASNWKEQFLNALFPGGYDKNRKCKAKPCTWISHIISFPWKFVFAFVPPSSLCGGIFTFIVALCFIAVLTMFIADLASLAGCCVGFKPAFTAITIVALGTSLPDAFASKAAAQGDKHADNSIGNITGSNSVNVFLGLGLPWCIASIYWMLVPTDSSTAEAWKIKYANIPGALEWLETHNSLIFVVPAGSLSFGVTVFCIGAVITLFMLEIRRYCACCGNGELGGPMVTKWLTFVLFLLIWVGYITLSGLNIYFPETVGFPS